MEYITNSPAETEAVGAALGKILPPGTILAYRGDLGAGKTAFTRGLALGGRVGVGRVTAPLTGCKAACKGGDHQQKSNDSEK